MTELPHIDISPQDWAIVRDILRRYVPDREVRAAGEFSRKIIEQCGVVLQEGRPDL